MENAILASGLDFSTPGGRLCNPGHSIEVSWFLLHLNKVLLDPEIEKIALSALLGAFEIGWDKECGGGQGFTNNSQNDDCLLFVNNFNTIHQDTIFTQKIFY